MFFIEIYLRITFLGYLRIPLKTFKKFLVVLLQNNFGRFVENFVEICFGNVFVITLQLSIIHYLKILFRNFGSSNLLRNSFKISFSFFNFLWILRFFLVFFLEISSAISLDVKFELTSTIYLEIKCRFVTPNQLEVSLKVTVFQYFL